MTVRELAAIWQAADAIPAPYGAWARMLILSGQRRTEVAGMRWAELSDDGTWLIPGGNLAHLVHVTDQMREILEALPRQADAVFPGERGLPICAFSFAKRLLDSTITEQRKTAKLKPPELPAWTWHDLRRSQQTWLVQAGFNADVVDRIANHRERKESGVRGIYQRYEYQNERKTALEAWRGHVVALAAGREPATNVVPMVAGRRV